ncbi:MAG: biosynthetic-type acetolactate synthase large subunit [Gammaproteobacteria bacterium]|nr:biosynthetic-type acetolactate synthase large subunit [Gammaproteobacteria bacterium]
MDEVTYADKATIRAGPLSSIRESDRAGALRGAQILAKSLQEEGVDVLFGYPGGANLEIFDVLREYDIRCIRTAHEQAAAHAATAYARSTGKVGVCLATSGPGATNLVTGIADANSDSAAIVAITGNVPSHLLGRNAFQEVDIVEIVKPVTKRACLVTELADIPAVVRESFRLAAQDRPGPVLIDIPKDVQQHYPHDTQGRYLAPEIPAAIESAGDSVGGLTPGQLEECLHLLRNSKRPVIYAGGGIVSSDSADLLIALAEHLNCPVTTTLMGLGAMPTEHVLFLDVLGMHGSRAANVAVNEADLVLALGVRFDDRVTGRPEAFIRDGKIIHIDVDRAELNKNKPVTVAVQADLRKALPQLLDTAARCNSDTWLAYLDDVRAEYPLQPEKSSDLTGAQAISLLSEMTDGKAIVSLGVGQHQMWAMQHYKVRNPRSFLSSSGFGTMGFGLPAAIGAKIGNSDRLVIDIDGDGSLNMSINELSTCFRYGLGVKVVVINNQWLGMVRQWQDMIYKGHRSESELGHQEVAKSASATAVYPDFVAIADGYGVRAERTTTLGDLAKAYDRLLADPNEPYLIDVVVRREDDVYPMIPAGGTYKDMIMSLADHDD